MKLRKFILTGAPGAGKTTLLRCLADRGYFVVAEAATDVIALEQQKGISEPWTTPSFIELILELQRQRQTQACSSRSEVQFFDRSPLDTYALCKYLNFPVSASLLVTIQKVQEAGNYERDVFFVENLGYIERSEARRISFEDSLRFEKIHESVYEEWGYSCLKIPRQSLQDRVALLESLVGG